MGQCIIVKLFLMCLQIYALLTYDYYYTLIYKIMYNVR